MRQRVERSGAERRAKYQKELAKAEPEPESPAQAAARRERYALPSVRNPRKEAQRKEQLKVFGQARALKQQQSKSRSERKTRQTEAITDAKRNLQFRKAGVVEPPEGAAPSRPVPASVLLSKRGRSPLQLGLGLRDPKMAARTKRLKSNVPKRVQEEKVQAPVPRQVVPPRKRLKSNVPKRVQEVKAPVPRQAVPPRRQLVEDRATLDFGKGKTLWNKLQAMRPQSPAARPPSATPSPPPAPVRPPVERVVYRDPPGEVSSGFVRPGVTAPGLKPRDTKQVGFQRFTDEQALQSVRDLERRESQGKGPAAELDEQMRMGLMPKQPEVLHIKGAQQRVARAGVVEMPHAPPVPATVIKSAEMMRNPREAFGAQEQTAFAKVAEEMWDDRNMRAARAPPPPPPIPASPPFTAAQLRHHARPASAKPAEPAPSPRRAPPAEDLRARRDKVAADLNTVGVGPLDVSDYITEPDLPRKIERKRQLKELQEKYRDVPREMEDAAERVRKLQEFKVKPQPAQFMPVRKPGSEFLGEAAPGEGVRQKLQGAGSATFPRERRGAPVAVTTDDEKRRDDPKEDDDTKRRKEEYERGLHASRKREANMRAGLKSSGALGKLARVRPPVVAPRPVESVSPQPDPKRVRFQEPATFPPVESAEHKEEPGPPRLQPM